MTNVYIFYLYAGSIQSWAYAIERIEKLYKIEKQVRGSPHQTNA